MSNHRERVVSLLLEHGYERRENPVRLASGYETHDFIDEFRPLASGERMMAVGVAFLELLAERCVDFDAVGGPTPLADPIAISIALAVREHGGSKRWFSVRNARKAHGRSKLIEGTPLSPFDRVLLVDGIVTTGESIFHALDGIEDAGATVVFSTALLDRGVLVAGRMAEREIPYEALLTYRDLGIAPVPR